MSTPTISEPHTSVECGNGVIALALFQIKEMKMEAHLIEDESCLTVRMKDDSQTLFFGKPEPLTDLAKHFGEQTRIFANFPAPTLRYAVMPRPIVTITRQDD